MFRSRSCVVASATAFAAIAALACGESAPDHATQLESGDIWIQNITVVSPERSDALPHAHVVIRGNSIVAVDTVAPRPARDGVTAIDGAGKYLVPGLIDAHVHLAGVPGMSQAQEAAMPNVVADYDRQLPRSYLYFGFTTVVDLNVVDRPRLNRLKAIDPGPEILDCGNALVLANGYRWRTCRPPRASIGIRISCTTQRRRTPFRRSFCPLITHPKRLSVALRPKVAAV